MNNVYQRPEGYEKEKKDCTVVALSLASNIPYDKVHTAFKQLGRKDGQSVRSSSIMKHIFILLNIKAKKVMRSGSVNKLIKKHPKGNLYCIKRKHAFTIIDGVTHNLDRPNSHVMGAWLIL